MNYLMYAMASVLTAEQQHQWLDGANDQQSLVHDAQSQQDNQADYAQWLGQPQSKPRP